MMRTSRSFLAAGLFLALAWPGPLAAQRRSLRLVAAAPAKYVVALCPLTYRDQANDGQKLLRKGVEEKEAAKREEALQEATRVLHGALLGGDTLNAAAWYLLARADLAQGDLSGADSAFTKAQTLAPDCELDIGQHRQNAWAIMANAGIEKQRAGESDSALALFRDATRIYRGLPQVYENMGVMFANAGEHDSAVAYFAEALAVAEPDSLLLDSRNSAAMNLVITYQRAGHHAEAVGVLHRYLTWNPDELDAKRSLAYSFRELNQADSAAAIEQQMVAEFAAMNLDSLPSDDLMAVGVSHFNDKQFDQAAAIFQRLVTRNAWSRDAVYNLTNAYLALKNNALALKDSALALKDSALALKNDTLALKHSAKLAEAGRHLLAIEPLNEDAYRLVANGYRGLERQDSLVAVAERLVMLPVTITVTEFRMGESSAAWAATVTGRAPMDPGGQAIAPKPLAMVLEFLGEDGQVRASEEVSLPALKPQAAHSLRVEGKATEIAAWRYRRSP